MPTIRIQVVRKGDMVVAERRRKLNDSLLRVHFDRVMDSTPVHSGRGPAAAGRRNQKFDRLEIGYGRNGIGTG